MASSSQSPIQVGSTSHDVPATPIDSSSVPVGAPLSSPNSVASTSFWQDSRGPSRKRQRTSWTEGHIIKFTTNGIGRRRCQHCHVCWSFATSTGTIAKHLTEKHCVSGDTNQTSSLTELIQPSLEPFKVSRIAEKRIDEVLTKYIVKGTLPHAHIEADFFKELIHEFAPGYQMKTRRTVKRSILQMYVVLRHLVIEMLSNIPSRFSITFDGWSNNSLKGFYSVTLHWVCHETARPRSMLLDFVNVFPGVGVGKRCGHALFRRLRSFGISSKLLVTISDGASDALVAAKELGKLLQDEHGKEILAPSHMLRCMVHTFQLGIKSALEVISPSTEKLRTTLVTIRSSKVRREVFRRYTRMLEHREREPPTLDVVTRWNSTLEMYRQALKEREVLNLTVADLTISKDFSGCVLTPEDWSHISAMEEWLETPAKVSTFLGGSRYPTLPIASLAYNCSISHCNKYLKSSNSRSSNFTQEVLQQASEQCLQYLIKYQDSLKSTPARIAMFLDPRLPVQGDHVERDLDIELVESILESHYHMFNSDVDVPSTTIPPNDGASKLWRLMGVDNRYVISSSRSEIEHFLKLPPAGTDKDPLQWWHGNKSTLARMYRMACDYLVIPASSVPAEEANSAAKVTFDDRSKLHSCTFKAEMCIRSWIKVLEESGITLPKNYQTAYEDLKSNLEDLVAEDDVIDYIVRDNQKRTTTEI